MNATPNPVAYPPVHDVWQLIARDTINGWQDTHIAMERMEQRSRAEHPLALAHWQAAHKKAAVAVVRASLALGVPAPADAFALAS